MLQTGMPLETATRYARFYLGARHTPERTVNLARTLRALVTRPVVAPNLPLTLKIEPSGTCQLACPGCPQSDPAFRARARGNVMSPDLFASLLEQAGSTLYRIVYYNYAEPFTNPELLAMIRAAADRGLGSQVSTNFSFAWSDDRYRAIVESGLEHLIVSLDGTDAATYGRYRVGGDFERVVGGLEAVVRWKRKLRAARPVVEWQFIVFEHNRHQIDEARRMARALGVDRLCFVPDGRAPRKAWLEPHRRRREFFQKLPKLNLCPWLWGALVVNWDGRVFPCCYAGEYDLGDLRLRSLADVWNGPAIRELRALVRRPHRERMALDPRLAPCSHCELIA